MSRRRIWNFRGFDTIDDDVHDSFTRNAAPGTRRQAGTRGVPRPLGIASGDQARRAHRRHRFHAVTGFRCRPWRHRERRRAPGSEFTKAATPGNRSRPQHDCFPARRHAPTRHQPAHPAGAWRRFTGGREVSRRPRGVRRRDFPLERLVRSARQARPVPGRRHSGIPWQLLVYEQEIRWHVLAEGNYRLLPPGPDGIHRSPCVPLVFWLDGNALPKRGT